MDVSEPFFFGQTLFGCYHRPAARTGPRPGVVLCQPIGHEYSLAHRAFHQLARQLAAVGHPVLRFDFYGCGDSGGTNEDGHLTRWIADLTEAVAELHRRSGSARVCLTGARLGATLAWLLAARRADLAALVVWDPILSGTGYLAALAHDHAAMLRESHVAVTVPAEAPGPTERLGFELSEGLVGELEQVALPESTATPTLPMLWVDSVEDRDRQAAATRLAQAGTPVERTVVPNALTWGWVENPGKVLVPPDVLRRVVGWLGSAVPA
jgi:alpha-beta hydrolase superfamily lysophospholipase